MIGQRPDGSLRSTTTYFDQFLGIISTTATLTVAGDTRPGDVVTNGEIVNASGASAGLDSVRFPQVTFPDRGGIRLDRFVVEFSTEFISGTGPFAFETSDYTGLPALSLRYPDESAAPLITPQVSARLAPADSDGDGLDDADDACPSSDLSPTVVIDGCNLHVDNALDATGCTISDRVDDCAAGARRHLGFTLCVGRLTLSLAKERVITLRDTAKILYCAARADLP
jgi:hypothetical protein